MFPLTPAQHRIWLADKATGECGAYNIPLAWRVRGPLQPAILERALNLLVQRHEALRTRVIESDTGPMQEVQGSATVELEVITAPPDTAIDALVKATARREAAHVFRLENGLPLRAVVLQLDPDDAVFLLTLHHVVADGWSIGVLMRELGTVYAALTAANPPRLAAPSWHYTDYLAHATGADPVEAGSSAFWLAQLAGASATMLPTDRPRLQDARFDAGCVHFELGEQLSRGLRALAAERQVTVFPIAAAALHTLLYRYTGQRDLVIGYPSANRADMRTRRLVGCFINTLVLRSHVDPHMPFSALLTRVADAVDAAREHQDADIGSLRPDLRVRVLLNFNAYDQPDLTLGSAQVSALPRQSNATPGDLVMILSGDSAILHGRLEYNTWLFDRRSATDLVDSWLTLLTAIVATPDSPLGKLDVVDAAQRARLLAWRPAPAAPAADVYAMVERQIIRCPERPAVLGDSGGLTYAALGKRVDALGMRLARAGAGAERPVAVLLDRGPATIVALLAVLKCGGVYVPLDTSAPPERLAEILGDLAPVLVLTEQALSHRLPFSHAHLALPIDAAGATLHGLAQDAWTAPPVSPHQLAYCIYTSGSTGKPKAVMVPRAALTEHIRASCDAYALEASDRVLQFAATSFDTSLEQMLVPLCAGAALLIRPEQVWAPDELAEVLVRERISVADIPTSYWHAYAATAMPAADTLRLLIAGGEPALASHQPALPPGLRTLNAYGPTETTVTCAIGPLVGAQFGAESAVPIGAALDGTRLYILDELLALAPPGGVGEIYIAGTRVARGYLGEPAMSAERFLPDPYGAPGERMYRSGDLGRRLPNGSIEFLGRDDQQVKVRGFRVELGEVESVLARLAAVRACAVCARAANGGERSLAAFVVAADPALTVQDLCARLQATLPPYMVPSEWALIDALPLTSSGKVDRKALLALPTVDQMRGGHPAAAVADPLVAAVLAIAARIGAIADLQPDDDLLLRAGFHSMQLVRLASQCSTEFGCQLSVRHLVKARTVSHIADHVRAMLKS